MKNLGQIYRGGALKAPTPSIRDAFQMLPLVGLNYCNYKSCNLLFFTVLVFQNQGLDLPYNVLSPPKYQPRDKHLDLFL